MGLNNFSAPNPAVVAIIVAAALAAAAPLWQSSPEAPRSAAHTFPGWPTHYDGQPLQQLPMTERETAFGRDFPGQIGRFTDGRREVIVRYVAEPTRRLHPAADCLKAVGYSITPLPARHAASGAVMSCLRAERDGQALIVCEGIRDQHGATWPDVSAWYWSAMLGSATGPWWSFVEAEAG